jgi:hypothetical protein
MQCVDQSVDPPLENRFQSVNAEVVQNVSDSGKTVICRSEFLSLDRVFEILKQEKVRGPKSG